MGERKAPGPRKRLSGEKRERFLEVLGQTGNRRSAAEAIGVEPRLMDQRREFDALLDRQWREALDRADRRLSGAWGRVDCIGGAEPMVITRRREGRRALRWGQGFSARRNLAPTLRELRALACDFSARGEG